ncbi:MAG: nickel pincer cofactor biosynthesis protein LarC [Brevinematales bacterium]|nr:nickel pincer cofactor biosynthesis protein LarC [Brevinematales bacterium]
MKAAYLDCFSGASGNMLIGALLDAGLPFDEWKSAMESLGLPECEPGIKKVQKHGITATYFEVIERGHSHEHRGLREIEGIIGKTGLPPAVKERAMKVFRELARVEGGIHGVAPEEVHFHEIGALDTIYDIAGTALGFSMLGIERVYASPVATGHGTVKCAHGVLPVPAPATLRLLEGIPVVDGGIASELTTPTGAALLREFVHSFGVMPPMTVTGSGYGAGSRDFDERPNLLRLTLGESAEDSGTRGETVIEIVTNSDNISPETVGYAMERLFGAGALDVTVTPVLMKKNRPGHTITVMAMPEKRGELLAVLFRETGTLGARVRTTERVVLRREIVEAETQWGKVRVKLGYFGGERVSAAPEYEDCAELARKHGIPFRQVYDEVLRTANPDLKLNSNIDK